MRGDEFEIFEAELERLKPAQPPEELVERLATTARQKNSGERQATAVLAQVFKLLYRRFSTCWRRDSIGGSADYKSVIQQSTGGWPPNLRYTGVLRWVATGAVAVAIVAALWFKQPVKSGKRTGLQPVSAANPALKADNVEIDRQLLTSFDAVARLPGGEPVRFRCREWLDQVLLRDSRRGLVIEQRTPRLEIVPVSFETY